MKDYKKVVASAKKFCRKNWKNYMMRRMKAKTLNSVERISKLKI